MKHEPAAMNLCRVCTCEDHTSDLVDIFEKQNGKETIAEMLLELAGIKAQVEDGLPRLCCTECRANLASAVAVRRKCIASDELLHTSVAGSISTDNHSDHGANDQCINTEEDGNKSKLEDAIYSCNDCLIDFYDVETLRDHYESKHANTIYGWKSFEISEVSLFDTTTDEEVEVEPVAPKKKKTELPASQNFMCCASTCCAMTFDSEAELKQHSDTVHGPEGAETDEAHPFRCNICYRVFTTPKGVAEHRSNKGVMRYQCAMCGIRIGKYHQLLGHEQTHDKRFICATCDRHFSTAYGLRRHNIARHGPARTDDAKRHICNQCGKCLHSAIYLRVHMKLHSDQEAYACPLCGARFKLRSYLRWHMVKHKGTHLCNVCHIAFKSPSELRSHMYCHSGLREFECTTCGKCFRSPKTFENHNRRVHKKYIRKPN